MDGERVHTSSVVATGRRARELDDLLKRSGFRGVVPPAAPRMDALSPGAQHAILKVYAEIGGTMQTPRLQPGNWDLAYEDGLVVELDEELHFNRYRRTTLVQDWCEPLPWRDDYLTMCEKFEGECLRAGKWGKRWTSPSTERMFGSPGPLGQLEHEGAPRWKQRALYDAMKDMLSLVDGRVRVARLAIHDVVAGKPLSRVLDGTAAVPEAELTALVEARTMGGPHRPS